MKITEKEGKTGPTLGNGTALLVPPSYPYKSFAVRKCVACGLFVVLDLKAYVEGLSAPSGCVEPERRDGQPY